MPLNDFDNYADLYNGVTAAQIRAAAEEPAANARVIADIATELGTDADAVTGATEGDITSDTRANAQTVQQSALVLSQAGTYGVSALTEFASYVEAFDTKVAEPNQRLRTNAAWSQRLAGQAAAENDEDPPEYTETWAASRAALLPEYNRAVATLDDNADATASRFEQGPTPANIRELYLAGLLPYTALTALWPSIGVSPQDRYDAYQAAVANGTIPAIEDMTEAERQAFLRDNPGILEDWTQIAEPSEDIQKAIVHLALPAADEEAARADVQTILDGVDDSATPEQIAAAFSRSAEIAAGMAVLLPWAQRNGIDLEHGRFDGRATDAQGYSEEFGRQTWEHRDAIETLLTEGVEREYTAGAGTPRGEYTATRMESIFSEAEADELRAAWAGSYLVASNEDIGGGWESLPEDMRYDLSLEQSWTDTGKEPRFVDVAGFLDRAQGDLPAGDGLSIQLAHSASELLNTRYTDLDPSPGGTDMGWTNGAHEELYGSLLERASLNHEATTFLLGGDPGWSEADMPHVPADFDHSTFVTNVYTHPWQDGGSSASSLTDWTIDPPAGSEALADAAFNGLYDTIAGNQEVYERLIAMSSGPGTGHDLEDGASPPTVGERNPELMRSLALATGMRLDQFDTATSDPNVEEQRIKMFMLINSDLGDATSEQPDPNSASMKLATAIEAYQRQRIVDTLDPAHVYPADQPHQRGTYGDDNGRLFGYNSAALRNAIVVQYGEGVDAAEQVAKNRQMAISILGTVPTGAADPLKNVITLLANESIRPSAVAIPEAASPNLYGAFAVEAADPTVLETVARAQVLDAMIIRDPSIASDFADLGIIGEGGNVDLSQISDAQTTHINDQLSQRMPDEVNEEIADLLTVRGTIVANHGLDLPQRYTGR
ncbi:hypothetical protein GCM10009821_28320 [Aeromicrobium halocynthiae]|uniref:TPR repeat domain-containing protein n=1 Tax=Aeromicrobium halocynthiae TaxID=560557 RepID=A0ABN2W807_9ACTN